VKEIRFLMDDGLMADDNLVADNSCVRNNGPMADKGFVLKDHGFVWSMAL
jgi:hypothetical protein